jgi:hypothetical protein
MVEGRAVLEKKPPPELFASAILEKLRMAAVASLSGGGKSPQDFEEKVIINASLAFFEDLVTIFEVADKTDRTALDVSLAGDAFARTIEAFSPSCYIATEPVSLQLKKFCKCYHN